MPIVGSSTQRVVGTTGRGLSDYDGMWRPDQPFIILREATVEEFLAEATEHGTKLTSDQVEFIRQGKAFFYEVATD